MSSHLRIKALHKKSDTIGFSDSVKTLSSKARIREVDQSSSVLTGLTLCNLCVLCASVVMVSSDFYHNHSIVSFRNGVIPLTLWSHLWRWWRGKLHNVRKTETGLDRANLFHGIVKTVFTELLVLNVLKFFPNLVKLLCHRFLPRRKDLIAGHETTVNLIGNGVLALIENPDQMDKLRRNPEIIKPAVEELLRYTAPVLMTTERYARENISLHGVTIPRGEMTLGVIGSANRDESIFDKADELDLTRDPNKHVSFGQGIHFCLGAPLARMEAQIAINTLLSRISDCVYTFHLTRCVGVPVLC